MGEKSMWKKGGTRVQPPYRSERVGEGYRDMRGRDAYSDQMPKIQDRVDNIAEERSKWKKGNKTQSPDQDQDRQMRVDGGNRWQRGGNRTQSPTQAHVRSVREFDEPRSMWKRGANRRQSPAQRHEKGIRIGDEGEDKWQKGKNKESFPELSDGWEIVGKEENKWQKGKNSESSQEEDENGWQKVSRK